MSLMETIPSILSKQIQLDQLLHADSWKETLSMMFSQLPSQLPSLSTAQVAVETFLVACILIAALQGVLIMHQYATNPSGELIVPPGLTIGQEDATTLRRFELCDALYNHESQVSCDSKKGWHYVTKFLVFLLPLLASNGSFAIVRYGHFLRAAVVMGLAHVYDFFHPIPEITKYTDDETCFDGPNPHIVVLGDSMSVGIGCVNEFDPDKNSGILRRIEQLEPLPNAEGPVFPRVLARTLSHRLHKPVGWRSAGVDGGDTQAIRQYLMGVIQEEVDKGKPPDLVVVLTGSNDLKRILSVDPEGHASVRGFCSNLLQLVKDIRAISLKTKVAFPALPTYKLDSNSILNVFPLSLFLEFLIGFWDAQKLIAADKCPGVFHVDLTAEEVNDWYKEETEERPTLLAADGIHPNAKCYAKWAKFVGNKLADTLLEQGKSLPTKTAQIMKQPELKMPAWGMPRL